MDQPVISSAFQELETKVAHFDLNKDNLESSIQDYEILLIDFWAEWCGPCKMFAPVFESASEKYPDIGFASCDTQIQGEVAGLFRIRSIPTLAIFKERIMIFQQAGALPAEALEDIIQQILKLDMDEVRKKIAEEEAKQQDK